MKKVLSVLFLLIASLCYQNHLEARSYEWPEMGETGPTGPTGPKGDTGTDGKSGTDGKNGFPELNSFRRYILSLDCTSNETSGKETDKVTLIDQKCKYLDGEHTDTIQLKVDQTKRNKLWLNSGFYIASIGYYPDRDQDDKRLFPDPDDSGQANANSKCYFRFSEGYEALNFILTPQQNITFAFEFEEPSCFYIDATDIGLTFLTLTLTHMDSRQQAKDKRKK